MLTTKIETERLILRALVAEDAGDLFSIFSDNEVMKYWNTEPWVSVDEAKTFITNSVRAMDSNTEVILGIYLKSTGQLLGKIMLFSFAKVPKSVLASAAISGEKVLFLRLVQH